MAAFSSTDAAFEGFRLTRERPLAVLAWAALLIVISFVNAGALVGIAGPAFGRMMTRTPGAPPDPGQVMADLGALAPAYAIIAVVALVVYSVLYAAVNRAVLRPTEGGPTLLKFGGDEFRQLGLFLLFAVMFFAAYIAVALLFGVLIGVGAGVAGASGSSTGAVIAGLLAFLIGIAVFCLFVWIAVRLSFASPLTFDRRRINLFGSWSLTRGRFWSLFGAYFLAWVMTIIIYLLALVIVLALAAAVGGGVDSLAQVFRPNFAGGLGSFLSPVQVVYQFVMAGVGTLALVISAGAPAHAYRQLTGSQAEAVFG